jgi:hypothetical protein
MREIKLCAVIVSVLIFLTTCANDSNAQSTILNTPSTDVVEEKRTYVEFDFLTHPTSKETGGFRYYGWRTVYGIRKGFEIGLNGSRTDLSDPEPALDLQPNAKWQFYSNEETGVAASVGGMMFIPTRRPGTDRFGFIYVNMSKQVNKAFGPRITGGVYGLAGFEKGAGTRAGVMIGIEQPVYKRVSFATDYMSGKNRFGYVTPAFVFTPTDKTIIGLGYTIGTEGRGNNALYFYLGHLF